MQQGSGNFILKYEKKYFIHFGANLMSFIV